ncbi:MAG: hypothetical protein AB7F22_13345 [Reyranella sp.]|uniref:hypothetical protein n=1 Tax=Reyranella sp. TaxID=1929291 RepID=UPI003D0A13E4
MLSFFKAFLPRPKVRTLAALQQLVEDEASYLAQRSVIDFSRNELGSLSAQAFDDPRFQAKLAVSRWEGFALTLADMITLAHALLQGPAVPRARLDSCLGNLYATILAAHPPPEHRSQGWDAEIAALRERLASRPDGPANPQAYAEATGATVFATLPFAPRDPIENRMVLSNAFAFGLIAFYDRLRRLLVVAPVRDEIAAEPR